MSPIAFQSKIKLVLGVSMVLMAFLGVVAYSTINRLIDAAQTRVETMEKLVLLERVAFSIKTAESSLRQYLLSASPSDRQNIDRARENLGDAMDRLRGSRLLSGQAVLDDLMDRRTTLALQSVAAFQDNGREAAVAILTSDLGRELRQRTDDFLSAARDRGNLGWQSAQAAAERSAQRVQELIIAAGLLLLGMLAWVVYGVKLYEQERKRVESQLRDSEAMSRTITEGMAEGVITTSSDDIVLEANAAALELFGYEKSELVGRDVSELVPQRLRTGYKEVTAALRSRPEAFRVAGSETRSVRKDGKEILLSVSFGDVQVGGRRLFTAMFRDITDSRRTTKALQASEMQLRHITDTIPALIAFLDSEQRFRFHNKSYEEVFGLSFEQINGRTLAEVLGQTAYESARDKVEEVLQGYPVRYERIQSLPQGEPRNYVMQYFPRYGEGADEGKVIGFDSLGTDITELKRIDRMKTEFVSTVSHELRTPLTSIRGSLGLIAGGVAGELPETAKTLVGIAKNNCERLIRLINDILDSEKIESGKMRLDLKAIDISQVVRQALSANEGFAGQHLVTMRLRAPDEPLQVCIDSDRMIQVLTNLLSNAIKFSPPDGAVEVNVLRVAQGIRVEVCDHGPGVPEKFKGRIFQKFSQADSSDTRQKGGTGLGLNISKALIEKMGGHIGFKSEAGAGATFFFELPEWQRQVPKGDESRAASAGARILICEGGPAAGKPISTMLGKAGFDADDAKRKRQADAGGHDGRSRILHVEDDPDVQRIVGAMARDIATFRSVATLEDARTQLQAQCFDLVLLDLALGDDSGWDLLKDIDALDPRPPVIVFSASDVGPDEDKRVEAVLVKAHTSDTDLLSTIERVLHIPKSPVLAGPEL